MYSELMSIFMTVKQQDNSDAHTPVRELLAAEPPSASTHQTLMHACLSSLFPLPPPLCAPTAAPEWGSDDLLAGSRHCAA